MSLRPVRVESALAMAPDLNLVILKFSDLVIGFSSVTLTTVLVGSFNKRLGKLDVSYHLQLIL